MSIYERKTPNSMSQLDTLLEKAKASDLVDLSGIESKDTKYFLALHDLKEGNDYTRYYINILKSEHRGGLSVHKFLLRLKQNFQEIDKVNLGEIIKFNGSELLGSPVYYHHALLSGTKLPMII